MSARLGQSGLSAAAKQRWDWMIDWVIECLPDGDRRACPPKRSGGGIGGVEVIL
jgi:hypothetical protein